MELPKTNFVVPAAPGYFILSPGYQEGKIVEACREPIVAFAVDSDGVTHPVTLNYIEDHGNPAILTPTGSVHAYDQTWETLDDWLAEQKAAGA